MSPTAHSQPIVIIGGGPAGLMAAEVLAEAGQAVALYDAMPSVGRKFLLAGVGGMNITHGEALPAFVGRYGERAEAVGRWLDAFPPEQLREWIHGLGIETFVGSSGRVFPRDMKAAPLLRAWLRRLRELGVQIHTRQRWLGWREDGTLRFAGPQGEHCVDARATLLALGGGSWPRLGSDGAWQALLGERGVPVAPLRPSNCGFVAQPWSAPFLERFAGAPVKPVALSLEGGTPRQGEFVITAQGVEGSLVYALSAAIRERIAAEGQAWVQLDLQPTRSQQQVAERLAKPRGRKSLSNHLRSQLGLDGVRAALLRELGDAEAFHDPQALAAQIKHLPLRLLAPQPLAEAISSAGGVRLEGLDARLMVRERPGLFCAGEMLDWEAPTGGYLLTACFASARVAARGLLDWLAEHQA